MRETKTIAVVGLGYVGLPLALELATKFRVIGFDLAADKIAAYRKGFDPAGELDAALFARASGMEYTSDPKQLKSADFVIVAVPTPVDEAKRPDFTILVRATQMVAENLQRGATVVYESTVYPGATEEVCVPVIEKVTGWRWQKDFWVGYSPERINPGDKEHTLTRVIKVVSGDSAETLAQVKHVYGSVISAGVAEASSIKVAEAAKVIENTQRDLNIALMNELSLIFSRLGIDTHEVLQIAGTKWNFLRFRPGLVGGHCIGVDPYYLTFKAESVGYHPEVILAGRRINDTMAIHVAQQAVKALLRGGHDVRGAKANVLGLTFKENCADLRNSKVADLIAELRDFGIDVRVTDALASPAEAEHEYGIKLSAFEALHRDADLVVLAVGHNAYRGMPMAQLLGHSKGDAVVVDVQAVLDAKAVRASGRSLWRP